jgi:hypothetical protein
MSQFLVDIFESFLGEPRKHNEDTGQVAFDCPACSAEKGLMEGDGKGNLEINYNRNIFHCWSCSETNHMHGPIIRLLKRYATPRHIRDYLLLKPDADIAIAKQVTDIVVELPDEYKKLAECTPQDYKYGAAIAYLRKRGIGPDTIKEFDIGYAVKGKYFNRIIIPSYDAAGKVNYFIARWFDKEFNKIKYLNPTAEKQEIVFNEAKINFDATIYIVEGATDHIVTPNSTPLLGKYISDKLFELLYDNAKGYIVIVLDDDAWEDAKNLYRQLDVGDLAGRIKIVRCPEGYDPSKIYEKLGPKGIVALLKTARKLSDKELY